MASTLMLTELLDTLRERGFRVEADEAWTTLLITPPAGVKLTAQEREEIQSRKLELLDVLYLAEPVPPCPFMTRRQWRAMIDTTRKP